MTSLMITVTSRTTTPRLPPVPACAFTLTTDLNDRFVFESLLWVIVGYWDELVY
eukprot:m.23054 g.23054  ORF g.23054 m.23054 type:complete len:54 (+) comp11324_c0_seq1:624-785(+)